MEMHWFVLDYELCRASRSFMVTIELKTISATLISIGPYAGSKRHILFSFKVSIHHDDSQDSSAKLHDMLNSSLTIIPLGNVNYQLGFSSWRGQRHTVPASQPTRLGVEFHPHIMAKYQKIDDGYIGRGAFCSVSRVRRISDGRVSIEAKAWPLKANHEADFSRKDSRLQDNPVLQQPSQEICGPRRKRNSRNTSTPQYCSILRCPVERVSSKALHGEL